MSEIQLNGSWFLSFRDPENGAEHTIPAQVPGNVLGDLHRAERIPDPFFGCNSETLRPYEFIDWEYRTTFPAPVLQPRERLELVFEGIDTFAEILINGVRIGEAGNMVIAHRFPVDPGILKEDGNELLVRIASTLNRARSFPLPAYTHAGRCCYEGLYLRRPMHTYGWDIAPRLVGAGIWRKVYFDVIKPERWTDLYLATTELKPKSAVLSLHWNFESDAPSLIGFEARMTLSCRDHRFEKRFPLFFTGGTENFDVENPLLWFPLGSGEQNLYTVKLELIRNGSVVDEKCWKTGIRTIKLNRTEMLDGEGKGEFVFLVNGRKIFIKGSNWVPSNAIHGEKPERVEQALELFVDLGCNMVRCWGGNIYEDEDFFRFCDEHGLLVWQDFMFACETAPQDEAFLESVRKEAESVVRALRNHPSLALWCGDNECDELFFYSPLLKRLRPSMNRITREILPRAVAMFDPVRDYLPSSPFLSDTIKQLNARYRSPEQHLWGPRDTWKGRFYKNNTAVFASEIGYHGMTDVGSIRKFIPEAELNDRHGPAWTCHSSQAFGLPCYRNGLMENQSKGFWGYLAEDLTEFMKCSQIVQAEAFKYLIELFRAKKWEKTGLIWWNVIDCWPQFSDAVVDYYHVRKLAYYYIKNAQKPLSLIVSDPEAWNCRLTAVNDQPVPAAGHYRVSDLVSGELFAEGEFSVAAESACEAAAFPVCLGEQRMLLIEWVCNGNTEYNHYLLGSAPFCFKTYLEWLKILDEKIYTALGRREW